MIRATRFTHLISLSFGLTLVTSHLPAQTAAQKTVQDTTVGHLETVATFNGPMPTGVTVSRNNRIFVNFPRWGDDVPYTVAEVVNGKTVAYPDASVNDWPGRKTSDPTQYKDQSQNENAFCIGAVGRRRSSQPLVGTRYWLPAAQECASWRTEARRGRSHHKQGHQTHPSATIHCWSHELHGTMFASICEWGLPQVRMASMELLTSRDSSEKGPTGIVVVDLASGQAWRKLDNIQSVKPEPGFVMFAEGRPLYKTEPGQPVKPGVFANDSLAISADGSKIFYCPVSATKLYSVPTAALRDPNLSPEATAAQVSLVTGKESSDGLESDAAGSVYSTAPASGSILKISPNPKFANGVEVTTLVHDPRLLWPDTMSLSDDGYLYVTANQLYNQPSMHNGKDLRQKPYVLFRVKVDAKPVRLQ